MADNPVIIYTDGACTGNPGPGGYAAVILENGGRREMSGGFRLTTNNRMELLAAIKALQSLKQPSRVVLYSDSQYLIKNYNEGSVKRWKDKGWMRDRRNPAKNKDLWQQLLRLVEVHDVDFRWVEGHAGDKENERCDRLSVAAARRKGNPPDEVFENGENDIPLQAGLFG
ncbi:MAG TPA: ribonuclease HI [Anaerolineaceae bacterium]|nr:ribonuclease HI [Anaerolineaceae bacterium]HQN04396.1 ribonuclease HI [Anaerolineaceae bacterium]HQP08903.1 ribonuclease HI [Anaerolineaceae bacterium]